MDQQAAVESLRQFEVAWEEARNAFLATQDDFADKLANARQTLRSCAGNVEKHKVNLEQLTESTKGRVSELRALIEESSVNADVAEKLKALETELAEKNEALAAAEKSREEVEARASAAEQRAKDFEGEVGKLKDQSASMGRELDDALQAVKEAQESGNDTAARITTLEDSEGALRAELDATKKALEGARKLEATAQTSAKSAENESAQARSRLAEAEKALSDAEKAIQGAAQDSEPLKAELVSVRAELESALAARVELQASVDKLHAEHKKAEAAARAAEDSLDAKEHDLAEARKALDDERRRTELAEHKFTSETAKGTKATIALQLAEAIQEAEDAKEELRMLKMERGMSPSTALIPSRAHKEELAALAAVMKVLKGQKRAIGELLVEADLLTKEQVGQAVEEQRKRPQTHVGAIFIEKEWCSDVAVAQALAYQCDSRYVALDEGVVDAAAAALINERLANQHGCIPLNASEESLTLAMANPLDLVAIEDVERATGRKVDVVVSAASQIKAAIGKYYWEP